MNVRSLGRPGRYGMPVLITPFGTWFWAPPLQKLDFIPAGSRTPTRDYGLRAVDNTLDGAVRVAAGVESRADKST